MSERLKEFTRPVQVAESRRQRQTAERFSRDCGCEHWPIVLNARYVVAVEDNADGGAMVTAKSRRDLREVMGLDGVVWVTQSRAEVCAWLRDLPSS